MSDSFAHLHCHTEYSMLDGAAKVKPLLAKAVALGQPAVASTDHGNVFSHYEMWKTAQEMRADGASIRVVLGAELYVAPASRFDKKKIYFGAGGKKAAKKGTEDLKDVSGDGAFTHMTMLAQNAQGLRALFELTSRASREGFYQKARVDAELVAECLDNWPGAVLIGTTGCPSGAVQTRLRLGQVEQAEKEVGIWRDILGAENYYLELMDHGNDFEAAARGPLMELATRMGLPLLATNDSHYVEADQVEMHDSLLCIQMGRKLHETDRMKFDGTGYHLRDSAEMRQLFAELPEACDNTLAIAGQVAVDAYDEVFLPRTDLLPRFPVPEGHTASSYLRERVVAGLQRKYPDPAGEEGIRADAHARVLGYELPTVVKQGYPDYMLMVAETTDWAREQGIRVGPGRGSAAGSGLSYALDITTVPTLEHGLLFERFINPERVSPPDVDVDFEQARRDEVFKHLMDFWGEDKVCRIQTLGTIKAKAAIKDAARVLDVPFAVGARMTAAYPKDISGFGAALACVTDENHSRYADAEDFRAVLGKEEGAQQVFDLAVQLEGLVRNVGVHACGIVVSSQPLMGLIPLVWSEKDQTWVSGFPNAEVLEKMGLLKMDCLGLDTMDVIQHTVDDIRGRYEVDVEADLVRLDDAAAYEQLRSGHTMGLFQVASGGLSKLLAQMRADRFEDISAALALYRPGPMGAEAHTAYALRKTGRQQVKAIHPELEEPLRDILGPTYGLCVTGDTLIWDATRGKPTRIDSVGRQVRTGVFRTYGIDPAGNPVARRVTHWTSTGRKPVLEITSSSGQILRVSAEHPVLTPDGWKQAGDLRAGVDRLARPTGEMEPLGPSMLDATQARFLGYLMGDGYCTLRANSFANKEPALIAEVVALAGELFPDAHPSYPKREEGSTAVPRVDFMAHPQGIGRGRGARKGESGGSVYDDLSLNVWLRSLGFVTAPRSPDWWVPDALLNSSNDVIRHYLAALWDCDGHVAGRMTFFRTISRDLATGVEQLLSRLGILARVAISETYESRRGEQAAYSVHVYDPKFWGEVVPLMAHPDKNAIRRHQAGRAQFTRGINGTLMLTKLHRHVLEDESTPRLVRTRVQREGRLSERRARAYLNRRHGTELALTSNAARQGRGGYVPHGDLAEAYLAHYGEELDFFYANQHWVTVENIVERETEEMFDITVEDVHNFLANGFVVHNCVYQETIMKAAQRVAGYSLGQADILRKIMGKKQPEQLAKAKPPFFAGMNEQGFSEEAAQALWDVFEPFSSYAFNISHTVSYGYITYATAWLKANYPAEFMAALLTQAGDNADKKAMYLAECRRMGITVLVPDVNESGPSFTPISKTEIRFGLNAVSGLGAKAVPGIISARSERPYVDFADFLDRVPLATCAKNAVAALIRGGAFDSLGHPRRALLDCYEHGVGQHAGVKKREATGQFDLFSTTQDVSLVSVAVPDVPEWERDVKLQLERDALGLYVSGHPLEDDEPVLAGNRTMTIAQLLAAITVDDEGYAADPSVKGAVLAGQLVSAERKLSRANKHYAKLVLADLDAQVEVMAFGRAFGSYQHMLVPESKVRIKVSLWEKDDGETPTVCVDSIEELDQTLTGEPIVAGAARPVYVVAAADMFTKETAQQLLRIVLNHPGERQLCIRAGSQEYVPEGWTVTTDVEFLTEVKELFGRESVRL